MRILVADNDEKRRELHKRILEKDKHEVLTATDRKEVDLAHKIEALDAIVLAPGTENIGILAMFYGIPAVAVSYSKQGEPKAFSATDSTVVYFNERDLEKKLRAAIYFVTSELAVA